MHLNDGTQPHGGSLRAKRHCKRPANALASARTFGAKHSRGLPPDRYQSRMAAACGQTALQTPRQRTRQRVHLRCGTQPGASARPLSKPHGGSLRAKGHCKHATNALASARTFGAKHSRGLPPDRYQSRMAAACGQKDTANTPPTPSPARAPSVRNTAGGCRPTAIKAAWRQPAGKRTLQNATNALASACTFGAKHSRGLPPDRYQSRMAAACGQKDTANTPPTHSPARAPSVRNTAGGFRPTAHNASRMAAACGRTALQKRCIFALVSPFQQSQLSRSSTLPFPCSPAGPCQHQSLPIFPTLKNPGIRSLSP